MLGTVVTGAGPHSGDKNAADRMAFDPETVSQLHADLVFLLVGLTVALLAALYAVDSPGRIRRAARDLLVVQLAQGVVGFVQYFTDLPIVLVLLHMLGAVLITAYTARLVWSVRGPASDVPLDSPGAAGRYRHPLTGAAVTPPCADAQFQALNRLMPRTLSEHQTRTTATPPSTDSQRPAVTVSEALTGRRPTPARRPPRRARRAARPASR